MKNRNSKKLAGQWFEKGNHDIEDTKRLYKSGGYSDTICFHCHQAVEKYLKGYLVFNNVSPRKIHDLVIFLEECYKIDKKFKDILESCKKLNKYYIESRYPAEIPILYTKEQTKETVEKAEKIITFISERMQRK